MRNPSFWRVESPTGQSVPGDPTWLKRLPPMSRPSFRPTRWILKATRACDATRVLGLRRLGADYTRVYKLGRICVPLYHLLLAVEPVSSRLMVSFPAFGGDSSLSMQYLRSSFRSCSCMLHQPIGAFRLYPGDLPRRMARTATVRMRFGLWFKSHHHQTHVHLGFSCPACFASLFCFFYVFVVGGNA